MIKLKYLKETNTIFAKVKGNYYLLPTLKEIPKPKEYLPCAAFTKELNFSDWAPLPEMEVLQPLVKGIEIGVSISNDRYRLFGHLPRYALNGIQNLLYKKIF